MREFLENPSDDPQLAAKKKKLLADSQADYDKYFKLLSDHNIAIDELPGEIDMMADDWPKTIERLATLVPDHRALYIDHQERTKTFKANSKPTTQKLIDLKINGDVAQGTVEGDLVIDLFLGDRTQLSFIRSMAAGSCTQPTYGVSA